ncbi:MAG: RAMP superfamily CRISPR-associated protein [Clostridia bacterium]|nr:RAMP superfamily CRISPR-associated protein [Clostridia bacterium]
MTTEYWAGARSRQVATRLIVEFTLTLDSPAHLGGVESEGLTDMPLLRDRSGGGPLLTGASISGALRSYLRERQLGFGQRETSESLSALLFGAVQNSEVGEGVQSPLIVEDSFGRTSGIEIRDGVRLEPRLRAAADRAKFDVELWRAGTEFPVRMELCISESCNSDPEADLRKALVSALWGLIDGSITLGARKRRGYGRIRTSGWRVRQYHLRQVDDLVQWLVHGAEPLGLEYAVEPCDLGKVIGAEAVPDRRRMLRIKAKFGLMGAMLIRSAGSTGDMEPDMVHIHSMGSDGILHPVVPGTSLAGALRARALRIASLQTDRDRAKQMIDGLFGSSRVTDAASEEPIASRVEVSESRIDGGVTNLVQGRVSIDRFTGGPREGRLFNEQPVFGSENTVFETSITVKDPSPWERGLMILLLKDLWTGDLPIGGEVSVGRGRLAGREARLTFDNDTSTITETACGLNVTDPSGLLERSVRDFTAHCQEERP